MKNLCMGCMKPIKGSKPCPICGFDNSNFTISSLMELLPGTILNDRYLVGKVVGHGGFGITYIGFDKTLQVRVAIKEFFPRNLVLRKTEGENLVTVDEINAAKFKKQLEKFLLEARTAAGFHAHSNIVSIRDFFEANDTGYIIMEYVEGMTLEDKLKETGGKLPYIQIMRLVDEIHSALALIHAHNLIHRDISPDNIFIMEDGTIKLIDFGASRNTPESESSKLTRIVKQGYSPLEQYSKNVRQGPWTDIYAFAATIYQALTGTVTPNAMERADGIRLVPPSRLGVSIPPHAEKALLKALQLRSTERYRTITDFKNDFFGTSHSPINRVAVKIQSLSRKVDFHELIIKIRKLLENATPTHILLACCGAIFSISILVILVYSFDEPEKQENVKAPSAGEIILRQIENEQKKKPKPKRKVVRRTKKSRSKLKNAFSNGKPSILHVDSKHEGLSMILDEGSIMERECTIPCILGNIIPGEHTITYFGKGTKRKKIKVFVKPDRTVKKIIK